MPTALPRIQVTVTPELDRALAAASASWPGTPRSALVARLAAIGSESLRSQATDRREAHRRALDATAGSLRSAYPPNYLSELRDDWPA